MSQAREIVEMIQAERDEQARHWRDIPDDDFPTRKATDIKLEEIQKLIREKYKAVFTSEQGSD